MTKEDVADYLFYEYNITDATHLEESDKYNVYERLKHRIIEQNLSPDEYTQSIINLAESLEL